MNPPKVSDIMQAVSHLLLMIVGTSSRASPSKRYEYFHRALRPSKHFVDRPAVSNQITRQIEQHDSSDTSDPFILVIHGLGGAGKTQLTLKFVHEHRLQYTGYLWIEARNVQTIERDYRQIYRHLFDQLNAPASQIPELETLIASVRNWIKEREGKWLLVFDNAEWIVDDMDSTYPEFTSMLPDSVNVHILVTCRDSRSGDLSTIQSIAVSEMEETEARSLFIRTANLPSILEEHPSIDTIVKDVGCLPLAVNLAASYLKRDRITRTNLDMHIAKYRASRKKILGTYPSQVLQQYSENVMTTWETSYLAVQARLPGAARMLDFLCFVSPDDLFMDLFVVALTGRIKEAGCDDYWSKWQAQLSPTGENDVSMDHISEQIHTLEDYSILQWQTGTEAYRMHPLVQLWSRERQTLEQKRSNVALAIEFLFPFYPITSPAVQQQSRILPHLMSTLKATTEVFAGSIIQDGRFVNILDCVDEFLREWGLFVQMKETRQIQLDHFLHIKGENSEEVLTCKDSLAVVLMHLGDRGEAIRIAREVLDIRLRSRPSTDPLTDTARVCLSRILNEFDEHEEAKELQKTAVEIRVEHFGLDDERTLIAKTNLAASLNATGLVIEAAELRKDVYKTRLRTLGKEDDRTLDSLDDVIRSLIREGNLHEAARAANELHELRQRILGEKHPLTLESLSRLAAVVQGLCRLGDAELIRRRLVAAYTDLYGEANVKTIQAMNHLLGVLNNRKDVDEAPKLVDKIMRLVERVGNRKGEILRLTRYYKANLLANQGNVTAAIDIIKALNEEVADSESAADRLAITEREVTLAKLLGSLGQYDEAIDLMQRCLEAKSSLGKHHHQILDLASDYANLHAEAYRMEEAIAIRRDVVDKRKTAFGPSARTTLLAMTDLAINLNDNNASHEAEQLHRQIIVDWEKCPDAGDGDLGTFQRNLAMALFNLGRFGEALDLEKTLLTSQESTIGADHPKTLSTKHNMAVTLRGLADLKQAESLQREVLQKREATLGRLNPDTIGALGNLAVTLIDRNMTHEGIELLEDHVQRNTAAFGAHHFQTYASILSLARQLHKVQGRQEDAVSLAQEALQGMERISPHNHTWILNAKVTLAIILQQSAPARMAEAIDLFRSDYARSNDTRAADHPDHLLSIENLIQALEKHDMAAHAVELRDLYEQLVQGSEKRLSLGETAEYISAAQRMYNLIEDTATPEKGDWWRDEAVMKLQESMLRERVKRLGEGHEYSIVNMRSLGMIYGRLGEGEKARELEERAERAEQGQQKRVEAVEGKPEKVNMEVEGKAISD